MSIDRFANPPTTGLEIKVKKGGRWIPRFFCDEDYSSILDAEDVPYLKKAPVCHLVVTPIVYHELTKLMDVIRGRNNSQPVAEEKTK